MLYEAPAIDPRRPYGKSFVTRDMAKILGPGKGVDRTTGCSQSRAVRAAARGDDAARTKSSETATTQVGCIGYPWTTTDQARSDMDDRLLKAY